MTDGAESLTEGTTLKRKLLRRHLRIGSWNVQTLHQTGKLKELDDEATHFDLDVVGVQEVRWSGQGRTATPSGHVFLYSGKDDDSHRSGVGLLLSPLASKALMTYECVSDRLLTARINCGVINLTVVVCYAPTEVSGVDEKDEFYQTLEDVLQKSHKHDVRMVIGDFNARVGSKREGYEQVLGPHAMHEQPNDNGARLLDACASNDLTIGGSLFPHKLIHKYTWTSNAGNKPRAQLDHILISRCWRRSMLDCRTYRSADISSDHELLVAKVKLKLARQTKASSRKRLDVGKLKDPKHRTAYHQEVRRRLRGTPGTYDTVENQWQGWRDAVIGAAGKAIGPMKGRQKTWISNKTEMLVKERKRAKAVRDQLGRHRHDARYRQLDREVKQSAKADKARWLDGKAKEMENAANSGQHRKLYQVVKEVTGKKSVTPPTMKGRDGIPLKEESEVKERWASYFQELLNRPPPERRLHRIGQIGEELDITQEPPTLEETKKAIQKLSNNKAAGMDGIVAELMKEGPPELISELHQLMVRIWRDEEIPRDWSRSLICTLYKKGDRAECSNYRGISLLSVPGKVFGHILLNRLRTATEKKLRENQGGFRSGRGCVDMIFCLRILMEKCIEFQLPALAIFIDFKAAFDSIHRPTMWHILADYGIPDKYIRLIRQTYKDCEAAVLVNGEKTDWFKIETGVRQGCVWSPLLFGLVIDFVLRKACDHQQQEICLQKKTRTLFRTEPGQFLTDIDYADDVTLLNFINIKGEEMLHKLGRAGKETGLSISMPKTKGMGIGETQVNIQLEGTPIDTVEQFKHLGSTVASNGRLDSEVNIRIGRASAAFGQLSKVWSCKTNLKTKLRIYNASVISTLLYGAETWSTTLTEEKRLDSFDLRCLRRILGIRWFHHVRNSEVRRRTGQPPASSLLKKSRLRWYGHVRRMDADRLPRILLDWNPERVGGKRRRGRCRTRWMDAVVRDAESIGIDREVLDQMTTDRTRWRGVLAQLMG